ncbi:MAG: hypothetical protein Kow0042_20160 [Calditrichia bacterium]
MSSIDIVFLIFILVFGLIGIWKGFFREVLGLVGVVAGVFVGIVASGPLSQLLSEYLPGIPTVIWPFICFIFLFILIYLSSRMLANLLSKLSQAIFLGWLNRLLGGGVGALKGAILISLILLIIGFLPFQSTLQQVRNESMLYEPLQRLLPTLYNIGTGFSVSSRNFEKKLIETLEQARVKLSEEMMRYFLYGNSETHDTK